MSLRISSIWRLFQGAMFVFLLCAGTVCAQESGLERRMDQAWRDAMAGKGKAFEPSSKSNFTAKSFDTKSALVKPFYFPRSFRTKDFLTGNYKGNKNFWIGDFKYDVKSAETGGRTITSATKFPIKEASVKADREAAKSFAVSAYPTKASNFRGASDDRLKKEGAAALAGANPAGWQGKMNTMSIDEIRDLLNKTK